MLLSMLFDDDDETAVSALFQVGDVVLQLKQKPHEGREYNKEKEDLQEYAMAHPDESYHPSSANGEYDSAFPCVGLVVWQSGFVLAEYLLRTKPLGPWGKPLRVLELGCGTGQLGIALALGGADVTLTDLSHITPLTQDNVNLNAARCAVAPRVTAYMWGTPVETVQAAAQQQQQAADHCPEQRQQQQAWDVIVAADVLYEPHHYDELLASLQQLSPPAAHAAAAAAQDDIVGASEGPVIQAQQHRQQASCTNHCSSSCDSSTSPPIYICYRVRRYGEHGFEAKAQKCGFQVEAVPIEELHADYRCGGYRLISLTRQ